MTINYSLTDRKPLVNAISEFTGVKPRYMRTPTYAYEIGEFTVTREGNIETEENTDKLVQFLGEKGFAIPQDYAAEKKTEPHSESVALTVKVPLENVSVGNLTNLLDAKGYLIKKALGLDDLPIEVGSDSVSFPWFSECADADSNLTRTQFIFALCKMSKQQKRINAHEKPADNEKYAFRCFLLRLGFIGDEFKTSRKILLRNFTGSSAFKGGVRNDVSQ